MYPLQMQSGDDPVLWIQFTQVLRKLIPGLGGKGISAKMPLPLHLAEKMEEYLWFK